jgi:hypothetical protein
MDGGAQSPVWPVAARPPVGQSEYLAPHVLIDPKREDSAAVSLQTGPSFVYERPPAHCT